MCLPRNLFLSRVTACGQLAGGFVREWVSPAASFIQTPEAIPKVAPASTGAASHHPTVPVQPIPPCGAPRNHAEEIANAIAASKYERNQAQFYQRHFEMEC